MSTTQKRKRKKGITFPSLVTPNTGIHIIKHLAGPKYKIWFHEDGRKQYVSLPKGITLAEARERRNHLYANLKERYGARRRNARLPNSDRPEPLVTLTPGKYIYKQKPYVIRIGGRRVGEANTVEEAASLRNQWLRENAEKVPHIIVP